MDEGADGCRASQASAVGRMGTLRKPDFRQGRAGALPGTSGGLALLGPATSLVLQDCLRPDVVDHPGRLRTWMFILLDVRRIECSQAGLALRCYRPGSGLDGGGEQRRRSRHPEKKARPARRENVSWSRGSGRDTTPAPGLRQGCRKVGAGPSSEADLRRARAPGTAPGVKHDPGQVRGREPMLWA